MAFHLICVHPFGQYVKGQRIEDPTEVAILMDDRDHHFVRVYAPAPPPALAVGPAAEPLAHKADKAK